MHHVLMNLAGRPLDFFIPDWVKKDRNAFFGENIGNMPLPDSMDSCGILRFEPRLKSIYIIYEYMNGLTIK